MTEFRYKWQEKFESGEYISTWNGYSPYYIGCFSAGGIVLGGEEQYSKCHGWFSGIGDAVWWVKEELDNLSPQHQDNLLKILKRNKQFDDYRKKIYPQLAKVLNVENYQVARLSNKDLYNFLMLVHTKSYDKHKKPEWEVDND
jgi:hypothetical protein